ncbi:hypothetical protein LTR91_022265 [Friedmanniomyces endolithicus]|uniref:Uncharacterized protein n=1 Tax=Friedmanniomyces endolithicus TaxID=329885 RepID=A0AAN6K2M6_9PEZI|nr:hypothetical protein LTS00_009687 [Friedmanniomyces endolithicus]KAK0310499.1 hypothetical protein LTR01_003651 [Friedmanniomyces endolithicus]KAK0320757.1 hypothetical protein LTR82_008075 [Friedmanniomyces endolithicus]KAK0835863.1 hypothetical protein LTR73_000364 [Friedmanniomyces endolithicus]KAK0919160.1 hypothetical protein LTR57_011070 [Friedmanniomyces endolithicus]
MSTSILISILGFGLLGLAVASAQLEVRQAATFSPQAACTASRGKFSKGYNCLNSLGAATASAYCSSRFSTTSTATTPTYMYEHTASVLLDLTDTRQHHRYHGHQHNLHLKDGNTVKHCNNLQFYRYEHRQRDLNILHMPFFDHGGTVKYFTDRSDFCANYWHHFVKLLVACLAKQYRSYYSQRPNEAQATGSVSIHDSSVLRLLGSSDCPGCVLGVLRCHRRHDHRLPFDQYLCVHNYRLSFISSRPLNFPADSSVQVTLTRIITPTATVTAVATANSTRTATVTTAYPLPTSNFILLYPSGQFTLYGRARNLSSGVAIGLAQYSADNFRVVSGKLEDVSQGDDIVTEPPPGVLDLLFLVNTTSSTQSTPICYVCGDTQTIGCDFPDASGNVTNPGQDVWANCGGYLSLGLAADFANPPLGVSCSIIRRLYYSLSAGSGTS